MMTLAMLALQTPVAPVAVVPAWVWVLLSVAGLIASATDLRAMRIPNWLTFPLFFGGLAYGGLSAGLPGLGNSLGGAAIAGGLFLAAYIIAGGGAGDAKMMMALGAWLGWQPSVVLVLGVTIAGFLYALAVTTSRGSIWDIPSVILHGLIVTRTGFRKLITGRFLIHAPDPAVVLQEQVKPRPKDWFPYAPAIFVGTVASWWYWVRFGSIV
jgi:Flp pilus assembly protein protease CpaA